MRETLDRLICARWPTFMRQRSDMESCMQYGVEHGDGWFMLLDAVSETITTHAAAAGCAVPEAEQVKEKFDGASWFWLSWGPTGTTTNTPVTKSSSCVRIEQRPEAGLPWVLPPESCHEGLMRLQRCLVGQECREACTGFHVANSILILT
jgi:hypothetical protein